MLLSFSTAQTTASSKPALNIDITSVTRGSSGLFEIHYALRNRGSVDVYLPYHEIGGTVALTTYTLLQRNNDGRWIDFGPSYDVPSYKAQIVHHGATLSLVEPTSAPTAGSPLDAGGTPSKPCTDVRGCYKIRVGYYAGEAAWQRRVDTMKEQQRSHQTLELPQMEFAYSQQFEIPPVAK